MQDSNVVNKGFNICAGHTRYKAATQMGLSMVPVIIAPQLIGDKFTGHNIADNQDGLVAQLNDLRLSKLVTELRDKVAEAAGLSVRIHRL